MKKKMKKKLLVMSVFLSMLVFTDLSFSEVQEEIILQFCKGFESALKQGDINTLDNLVTSDFIYLLKIEGDEEDEISYKEELLSYFVKHPWENGDIFSFSEVQVSSQTATVTGSIWIKRLNTSLKCSILYWENKNESSASPDWKIKKWVIIRNIEEENSRKTNNGE